MMIANNEIQPYHKPFVVLKPSVTSAINCRGSLKTNQRKRCKASSLAYRRTSAPSARVDVNNTIMILVRVRISMKWLEKKLRYRFTKGYFTLQSRDCQRNPLPVSRKFLRKEHSIREASKKRSSFHRITEAVC